MPAACPNVTDRDHQGHDRHIGTPQIRRDSPSYSQSDELPILRQSCSLTESSRMPLRHADTERAVAIIAISTGTIRTGRVAPL